MRGRHAVLGRHAVRRTVGGPAAAHLIRTADAPAGHPDPRRADGPVLVRGPETAGDPHTIGDPVPGRGPAANHGPRRDGDPGRHDRRASRGPAWARGRRTTERPGWAYGPRTTGDPVARDHPAAPGPGRAGAPARIRALPPTDDPPGVHDPRTTGRPAILDHSEALGRRTNRARHAPSTSRDQRQHRGRPGCPCDHHDRRGRRVLGGPSTLDRPVGPDPRRDGGHRGRDRRADPETRRGRTAPRGRPGLSTRRPGRADIRPMDGHDQAGDPVHPGTGGPNRAPRHGSRPTNGTRRPGHSTGRWSGEAPVNPGDVRTNGHHPDAPRPGSARDRPSDRRHPDRSGGRGHHSTGDPRHDPPSCPGHAAHRDAARNDPHAHRRTGRTARRTNRGQA